MPKFFKEPSDGTGQFCVAVLNLVFFLGIGSWLINHCLSMDSVDDANKACADRGTPSDQNKAHFMLLLLATSGLIVTPISFIGLKDLDYYIVKLFASMSSRPDDQITDQPRGLQV